MSSSPKLPSIESSLPAHKDLYYGGQWHAPKENNYHETYNPGNGQVIDKIAQASAADTDAAIQAAHAAFPGWRSTPPMARATILRKAASLIRENAAELALLDAYNTGNPVSEMLGDGRVAATSLDYFAGLIPMLKGETIPQEDSTFHYTIREPLGVVARIVAYNHPIMFAGAKMAAPLAAGNVVIIKPPEQAPLSALRLAEVLEVVFPPGVFNVLPGGVECGKTLSTHPLVKKVTLIGSVVTGKAIQRAAADSLKPTLLELGGKNALLAFPDADIDKLVEGVAKGMNFTWAGQSCGSTSRVFLHESHYDEVLGKVKNLVWKTYKPGSPMDMKTTMGPLISRAAQERTLGYIESAKAEGAKLICGGGIPSDNANIKGGYFVEPTIFGNVSENMRIANEEIFGPVMSVLKWKDEEDVIRVINSTNYGLTASIYTKDISVATETVGKIEAGFIWVNQTGRHFMNVPFGGYKESGMGKEECLDELLAFTQIKSVNLSLAR